MASRELMYGFVILLLATGGMVVMFNAANNVYLPFMVNETLDDTVGIPVASIVDLESEAKNITKSVSNIQSDLQSGSQFTGVALLDKGIQLFFTGWEAIETVIDVLISSLTFFSRLLSIDALAPYGLDWVATLFVALVGIAIIFQLLNIAFKGRFT